MKMFKKQVQVIKEKLQEKIMLIRGRNIEYEVIPWEYECLTENEIDFMCYCKDKIMAKEVLKPVEASRYNLLKYKADMYYCEFAALTENEYELYKKYKSELNLGESLLKEEINNYDSLKKKVESLYERIKEYMD